MMPKIFKICGYSVYFWSKDINILNNDENIYGLSDFELKEIDKIVSNIVKKWREYNV